VSLLSCQGLSKNFDGVHALQDFSFTVEKGEVIGIIGPNGAGKTTLFNVLSGFIPADSGSALFKGKEIIGKPAYQIARLGIGRTFQILRLIKRITVLENVLLAFQHQPGEKLSGVVFQGKKMREIEARNRRSALALLEQTGLLEKADNLAEALSFGQQKLLSLVCCLAMGSELILLDEPVAGIAPEMIEKILGIIQSLPAQGKTIVLIEHNMDVIARVCTRVIFMDEGKKVVEGKPEEVRNDNRVIEAYLD